MQLFHNLQDGIFISPRSEVGSLLLLLCQERLEKEKKLSKDLGQAATKLQQLLKASQEQLTKERDTVRTLQEHLEGKVREFCQHTPQL